MRSCHFTRNAALAALLASSLAWAQSSRLPGFELERLDPNPGRGPLLIGSGELLPPNAAKLMLLGNYQLLPLVIQDQDVRLELVRHRAVALLSGSYAVLPWLELDALIPVVLWQTGEATSDENLTSPASQGLGTPVIQARLGLLAQRWKQPIDLALDVGLGLPLGSTLALGRDPGLRFHSRLALGGKLGGLRPSLEAGLLLRPTVNLSSTPDSAQLGGPELHVGAALATVSAPLGGEVALRATLPSSSSQASVEVQGGVRYLLSSGLELFGMAGVGLGSLTGTPLVRVVGGLSYTLEQRPKFEFLEDSGSSQLREAPPEGAVERSQEPRPVQLSELNALRLDTDEAPDSADRGGAPDSPSMAMPGWKEGGRPFQPGPGESVLLRGTVLFENGNPKLSRASRELEQVAPLVRVLPDSIVLLEGHSDIESGRASDQQLSLRRAEAVKSYLVGQGVPASRVLVRGFGSAFSASTDASPEGRKRNRRVEILLVTRPAQRGAP